MFGLFKKKEEIDYKELIKQGAIILDVRSKEEFEAGYISGAINIPLDILSSNLKKLGNKDTYIITYCVSGARSGVAKNVLQGAGYRNVYNGGGWYTLQNKLQQI